MLVAYHEEYLLLIKICALFCMLVMVYNLYDHLTQKQRTRCQEKRVKRIRQLLETASSGDQKKQRRALKRQLRKPLGLLALLTAMEELNWTESDRIPPQTRWLLCDLLLRLHETVYSRAEDYIQGLLMSLYIRCNATSSRLKSWLLDCMDSNRPLVRVEALRCICAQQNRKMVLHALERISREPLPFSNKLIVDTLMTFRGSKELLLEELWENLSGFSPEIQVSVVQMLGAVDHGAYAREVMGLLQKEKADMEVRLAAMKYFAAVKVPECVPALAEYLSAETWEYAAVAAKVLENYDCTAVFETLKKGICNRNWYVRSNCARTIVRSCSPKQVREALEVADRYGRDSVHYALQMAEKEVAAV